eukprot:3050320-Rhodomonas_salina.1
MMLQGRQGEGSIDPAAMKVCVGLSLSLCSRVSLCMLPSRSDVANPRTQQLTAPQAGDQALSLCLCVSVSAADGASGEGAWAVSIDSLGHVPPRPTWYSAQILVTDFLAA